MKLILEKNLVTEVTKVPLGVTKKAVCYNGRDIKGDEIELYDMEAGSVAPIVRYLITGKKKKLNWWLIILAIILSFLLLGLMGAYFLNDTTTKPTIPEIKKEPTAIINPVNTEVIDEKNNRIIELSGLLEQAEGEIIRLTNIVVPEAEIITEIIEKEIIIEKIRDMNENEKFTMYLGNLIYNKCDDPKYEDLCSKLYFNYMQNAGK